MELNVRTALGIYQTFVSRHLPNIAFHQRVTDKFGKSCWGVDLFLDMTHEERIVLENK